MKTRYLLSFVIGLLVCSCTTIKRSSTAVPVKNDIMSWTVADLDVSTMRVSMTYSWNFNPFKSEDLALIRSNTTARILLETESDVLVDPQYIIERRGFLRGGSVTVTGFPAKYTGFHKPTTEEDLIIQAMLKSGTDNKKGSRKRFFFF